MLWMEESRWKKNKRRQKSHKDLEWDHRDQNGQNGAIRGIKKISGKTFRQMSVSSLELVSRRTRTSSFRLKVSLQVKKIKQDFARKEVEYSIIRWYKRNVHLVMKKKNFCPTNIYSSWRKVEELNYFLIIFPENYWILISGCFNSYRSCFHFSSITKNGKKLKKNILSQKMPETIV